MAKKIARSVTFFIVPRNTTQNMVFQVDSETIADMNWFWLDKKAAPTGRLFCTHDATETATSDTFLCPTKPVMTLHPCLTACLLLASGLHAWGQNNTDAMWHLPEVLGSAPAVWATDTPPGYVLAESQACVAQVVTYDLFCEQLTWDDLCQEAYECCMAEDDILNLGCTNVNACNYDPTVCVDVPISCVFCLDHCFTLQTMDAEGDGWQGVTWSLLNAQGQTLQSGTLSNGYNALAAGCLDDGCYTLEVDTAEEGNDISWVLQGSGLDEVAGGAGSSTTFSFNAPAGCTTAWACNYDAEACEDDGSCVLGESDVTDMTVTTWDLSLDASCTGDTMASVLTFVEGFTAFSSIGDEFAWSLCDSILTLALDPMAVWTGTWNGLGFEGGMDGEGCFTLYPTDLGCTDDAACNYDPDAVNPDGSCTYPGCMNPLSCNFDAMAGCPAPCDLPLGYVEGCTNPLSINYDVSATVDDGSCDLSYMCLNGTVYDEQLMGCVPVCPGDMNFDGAINVSDLLDFLLVYDTFCP